jgi:hypothetical protein
MTIAQFNADRIDTWVFRVGIAIPVVCVLGLVLWNLVSYLGAKLGRERKPVRIAPEPPRPSSLPRRVPTDQAPTRPDRWQALAGLLPDLAGGRSPQQLAAELQNDPERLQRACVAVAELLAEMYLELAESWRRRGQPLQAAAALRQIVQSCPETRQAQVARERLGQIGTAEDDADARQEKSKSHG